MSENKSQWEYRVFGRTTAYPHPEHVWAMPDEEAAIKLAVSCAEQTGTEYEVYKVVATVGPKPVKVDVIVTKYGETKDEVEAPTD